MRVIPREIADDEILVRSIFERKHFKSKIVQLNRIIDKEVFFDKRGVSLQRRKYCNESECKSRAKQNPNIFRGFVIFKKSDFQLAVLEFQKTRPQFKSELVATPLDKNDNIIPKEVEITTKTEGNPAHADIECSNPGLQDSEVNTPNVPLKRFSKILFKHSKTILDANYQDENYSDKSFEAHFEEI